MRFSSGHMLVSLDPDTKKVNIAATIHGAEVSGKVTLKPAKADKEVK